MTKDTSLLVTTVKNEGHTILEWVAHHRLCGFDRIQIYQSDSADTTAETLQTLSELGVIEYHENRHKTGAHHRRAYRRASQSEAFGQSDWCMALDGDDYLNITVGDGTVIDLINACPEDADAILVNRKSFGSDGHQYLDRSLITERFTHAEPAKAIVEEEMAPFKALFRTAAFAQPGIYLPREALKSDPVICNGSGLREGDFLRKRWRGLDPLSRRHAQVHHYGLRDLSSFLVHNSADTDTTHRETGLEYWRAHDRNEEQDLSLVARAPELWDEMQRLDGLSGGQLLRLRQKAIRKWRVAAKNLAERKDITALRDAILGKVPEPVIGQTSMVAPFRLPGPQAVFASVRAAKEAEEQEHRRTASG